MSQTPAEPIGPPRVTALIVTRNASSQLQRCLEALERSQHRDTLEILVVDNGSSDETPGVVAGFPDIQNLRLPKDFGRTKASNIGMRTAKGDFLFFVPTHVEVHADTVTRLADRLAASDAVGAVHPYATHWFRLPGPEALAVACRTGELPDAQTTATDADEVAVEHVPRAPLMARRMFLRGMNYFDERFGDHWSDLELCWQLRNAGKTTLILPQAQVTYHQPPPPAGDAIHRADCVIGASGYLAKHFGAGAGAKFRLMTGLRAFASGDFGMVSALLSGQKVDGTHL